VRVEVAPDADVVARRAAAWIAGAARDAVAARGRCALAFSGGRTPGPMLRALAGEDVPWAAVHVFQVDERVAPDGDPARNWTGLADDLLRRVALPDDHAHAMPVGMEDPAEAAAGYADALAAACGTPAVLDVVQLGLGPDGHTASLVPGDPVLGVADRDVACTGPYAGHRRLTLTYPALDRARRILWVVTGAGKAAVVPRLVAGDRSIPAGRVGAARAVLIADAAAASGLGGGA